MIEGLIAMRKMHIRAIKESGLTCADEMLYRKTGGMSKIFSPTLPSVHVLSRISSTV